MILAPPDPVTDTVRHVFYFGSTPVLYVDVPVGEGKLDFPMKFLGNGWTLKACPMADGEFATVIDQEGFDGDNPAGIGFTPTNADIPPISDLTLEYDT